LGQRLALALAVYIGLVKTTSTGVLCIEEVLGGIYGDEISTRNLRTNERNGQRMVRLSKVDGRNGGASN
jgi:hypothetical protein